MRFTPVSEQEAEAQSANLWPNGTYDYEIRDATEKESAAGNEMVELEVWLFDTSGNRRMVFDYLVSSEKAAWKIRHFAESCGLLSQYEQGVLMANEMVGRTGKCTVATQPARDGYQAKNVIRDYVKAASASHRIPVQHRQPARESIAADLVNSRSLRADDLDDEIPF